MQIKISPEVLVDQSARASILKDRRSKSSADSIVAQTDSATPRSNADRFMAWIQQGVGNGELLYNESSACIHFVAEGMLILSPKAFQEYARVCSNAIEIEPGKPIDSWRLVQRDFQQSAYPQKGDGGTYLHYYTVSGPAGMRLAGLLVPDPACCFNPVPRPWPSLQLAPSVSEHRQPDAVAISEKFQERNHARHPLPLDLAHFPGWQRLWRWTPVGQFVRRNARALLIAGLLAWLSVLTLQVHIMRQAGLSAGPAGISSSAVVHSSLFQSRRSSSVRVVEVRSLDSRMGQDRHLFVGNAEGAL